VVLHQAGSTDQLTAGVADKDVVPAASLRWIHHRKKNQQYAAGKREAHSRDLHGGNVPAPTHFRFLLHFVEHIHCPIYPACLNNANRSLLFNIPMILPSQT
jgi:hypothetical protein